MAWYTQGGNIVVGSGGQIADDGGGNLINGQSFTVTGSGFGTKSRALSWLLADKGTDPVGTISSQYDSTSPNNGAPYVAYNVRNQLTTFNPTGSLIGTPHPYVGAILGGATAIPFGSGDYQVWGGKHFTLPTLPCVLYASWYQRSNPDWAFGIGSPNDYNYKFWCYSNQNAPATGNNYYMAYDVGGPVDNTVVSRQVNITDDSTITYENPDGNGHNNFWGNALSPFRAANGWTKCEVEILITTATGLGGGGFIKYTENNGSLIINYAGRTDNFGGTSRYFYLGAYNRDYPNVNNWRCWADPRFDLTGTISAGAHCARLMVGNANTLTGCTILEPADITAWSNTGSTFNFWKGNLPSLSTGYFYAFTEAGTVVIPTPASATII